MSMSNRTLASIVVTLALGGASAVGLGSCQQNECGTGTILRDGECVPGDEDFDNAMCGQGTVLGPDGKCEAELPPTVCDPTTTIPDETTTPGVITCYGTGTTGGCETPLICSTPAAGKISFCGRIHDVGNDGPISAVTPTKLRCDDPGAAQDGACQLQMLFYDAIDIANNPSGAQPLGVDDFFIDDCGRFQANGISFPSTSGLLAIGVDDKATAADVRRTTGVAFKVTVNQVKNGTRAYSVTQADNMAWSTAAGMTTTTFVDQGAFMAVFYRGVSPSYTPVSGVQITENGVVEASNDWYFSDTTPTSRKTIGTASSTGINGTGIKINSILTEHSGTGGTNIGSCTWSSAQAKTIQGFLFFSQRFLVNGTTECP